MRGVVKVVLLFLCLTVSTPALASSGIEGSYSLPRAISRWLVEFVLDAVPCRVCGVPLVEVGGDMDPNGRKVGGDMDPNG
jgi:hypothetical protein